jgi:hypothetical protein
MKKERDRAVARDRIAAGQAMAEAEIDSMEPRAIQPQL